MTAEELVPAEPEKTFTQIAKEASELLASNRTSFVEADAARELHPHYSNKESDQFMRELYRLKGFAYLRNQQKLMSLNPDNARNSSQDENKHRYVVKAASNFQKALTKEDSSYVAGVSKNIQEQKRRKVMAVEEQYFIERKRATFRNFRMKLEGGLAEEEPEGADEADYDETNRMTMMSGLASVENLDASPDPTKAP